MITGTKPLDQLAEAHSVNLWLEIDDDNPRRYAVWCEDPEVPQGADIIGAGDWLCDAYADAYQEMSKW